MSAEADDLHAAWDRLLDGLRIAGEQVTGPLGARDDRELAEGYRHVLRVLSVAAEMVVEKGDRRHPEFTRWANPHRKILGDNPQTYYDAALIDPDLTYRIAGFRGSSTYLGVVLYGTDEDGARHIIGHLDDVDLAISDDGSFEVFLAPSDSREVPAGSDVLHTTVDTTDVMVRQYFGDRAAEEDATYTIEVVPDPGVPSPLDVRDLAQRLDETTAFLTGTVEVETTLSALMTAITPTNMRFGHEHTDAAGRPADPPIDPSIIARTMPSPAIQYSGSWTDDLGPDEAIVVSGPVPTSRYWSVQLLSRWMESGAWPERQVFLTGDDLEVDDDGRFRVVVAHRDPGTGPWLDTTGWTSFNTVVRAIGRTEPMDITFDRVTLPFAT